MNEIKYELDGTKCLTECPHNIEFKAGSTFCIEICPYRCGEAGKENTVFCKYLEAKKVS